MRLPIPDEVPAAEQLGRVHFVGIGGAALSGIARLMARRGVPVTGSDDNDTPFLAQLRELDVPCHLGFDASHVGGADTVVVTTAASPRFSAVWPIMIGMPSLRRPSTM